MNITFLIGNGFDLNLGLNTRYTNVYEKYIETESQSDNIEKFKLALKNDIPEYKNWSDFEMGMAKYAENFETEVEFIECVRDFKAFMIEYIRKEEHDNIKKIKDGVFRNAFYSSCWNFYSHLKPKSKDIIAEKLSDSTVNTIDFVCFNYTSFLQVLVEDAKSFYLSSNRHAVGRKMNLPVYIHGHINRDVILGVDNINQFTNLKFQLSRRGLRTFIKPFVNTDFDSSRVNNALGLINDSSVICIYGFALGASDNMWRNAIKDWLLANSEHHLIYNFYDNIQYSPHYPEDLLETEDEYKEIIFEKLGFTTEEVGVIYNQVHIPVGKNIFDFSNII